MTHTAQTIPQKATLQVNDPDKKLYSTKANLI